TTCTGFSSGHGVCADVENTAHDSITVINSRFIAVSYLSLFFLSNQGVEKLSRTAASGRALMAGCSLVPRPGVVGANTMPLSTTGKSVTKSRYHVLSVARTTS